MTHDASARDHLRFPSWRLSPQRQDIDVGGTTIHIDTMHIGTVTMAQTPAPRLLWHVGPMLRKGDTTMPLEVSMTTEEQCRLSITPLTPGGEAATIDGQAQWTVDGTCTLLPIDATSTWVVAGDTVGDSVVTVACDADMGSGVVPLGDTCLVHVATPMAANLGLAADQPVLQSEASPSA